MRVLIFKASSLAYADIRGGSLEMGVKRQWGCLKRQFSVLSLLISSEAFEVGPTLLYTVNRGNIVLPSKFQRKLE